MILDKPGWEHAFRKGAISRLRGGEFIKLEKNASNLQLKKEYELAKIEEGIDVPLIETISYPVLPIGPDPGKTRLLPPISLILGSRDRDVAGLRVRVAQGDVVLGAHTKGAGAQAVAPRIPVD